MKIPAHRQYGLYWTILAPMLIEEGYDVVGYDSDLYRECTFGDGLPEIPTIKKDIRDVSRQDLKGIDAVLHLAGLSNDPLGI
jgi:nucleoside-diphosphate-sugar epimerase